MIDVVVAASALLALSPILLIAAVAIRFNMGGPVLFRQERAGLNGAPFKIKKFRTMKDPVPGEEGDVTKDAERLTRLGSFLRKSSIDELPELLNVIDGSMSLVGPRPLFLDYLPLYSPEQAHRHDVRPGVTGWAQVNGRNAVSWEDKFEMDVWYVRNQSTKLDLQILASTVRTVLARDGVSADGTVTAHRFTGS